VAGRARSSEDDDRSVLQFVEPEAGPGQLDGFASRAEAPAGKAPSEALDPVMKIEPLSFVSALELLWRLRFAVRLVD
jgi:hypothetical protein